MHDDPLSFPAEREASFGTSFLFVMVAHVVLVAAVWVTGKIYVKRPAAEPITWIDGGGEVGASAPVEQPAGTPEDAPTPVAPTVTPPTPPEVPPPPKEPSDFPAETKARPTPTPTPRPKATPTPAPRQKIPPEKPKTKPSTGKTTPKPVKKPTPRTAIVKLDTSRSETKAAPPKNQSAQGDPASHGSGPSAAPPGPGNATNPGRDGGPGAPGGSRAVMTAYFARVTAQFRREWQHPLTVVRSGKQIEAEVRLRAGPDGTVESLTLEKPTGNLEVDQSIQKALLNVRMVERPPAELLKGGVLDERVVFILEL